MRSSASPVRSLILVLLGAVVIFAGVFASPAHAQQPKSVTTSPPRASMPVPNELELAKLIWSTMAAVDHANTAGNYSVLRDLSAPAFQVNNDPAKLAKIFESLRTSNVDLSNTLLLAPSYNSAPAIVQPGILHVKGYFGLRPTAIGFDFYYQWVVGRWRLFGVSIVPASITNMQPRTNAPRIQPRKLVPDGR